MTYNVFSGTLNPIQSIFLHIFWTEPVQINDAGFFYRPDDLRVSQPTVYSTDIRNVPPD